MAIYMKYGTIKGAVTTAGFADWIELRSFQWETHRGIGTAARGALSREHSEPSLSEVTVTKEMDVSSPNLLVEAIAGALNNTVTIRFTTTMEKTVETFLTYKLENTGISGYNVESGGDMPTETLSLNFTKISNTFIGMEPDLKGKPETVGYDMTQMKTI